MEDRGQARNRTALAATGAIVAVRGTLNGNGKNAMGVETGSTARQEGDGFLQC